MRHSTASMRHLERRARSILICRQWPVPACVSPVYTPHRPSHRIICSSAPSTSASTSGAAVDTHNNRQASAFSTPEVLKTFQEVLPDEIKQRLTQIVGSIPGLSDSSRVIDVGSGAGCLIPFLKARGVQDILAVDLSPGMLEQLRAIHGADASNVGNQLGVRTWQGDVTNLPNYLGWAADAFIFNAVFGNIHSPRDALLKAALQLKPGGYVVISHPLGRTWHSELVSQQPDITPHHLPDRAALEELIRDMPLQILNFKDEPDLYLALLQVPPRYHFPGSPVHMHGRVVTGYGRGSKKLGVPTANLDTTDVADALTALRRGVYFGWARLMSEEGPAADKEVHPMVMNVGKRPTVNTGDEEASLEIHVMHSYAGDFYGKEMKAVVLGYIRPEMRFPGGIPELLNRIKLDIAIGRNQLADPASQDAKSSL